ncbi:MAG: divergent PAP2 family protein [Candidatus Stahlbacteria bacterium]|nr:divergent PAP2 family protein [Candidatus Stahlbacteria bacterium]
MGYKIILLWALSASLVQVMKFVFTYIKERRIDLNRLIEPGGMPSSHSAGASTLSTAIGLACGFNTPIFAGFLFFSTVIVYESTGLRRAVGEQAKALNKLILTVYEKKSLHLEYIHIEELRVILGHTPVEVLLGILMGICFALAFF